MQKKTVRAVCLVLLALMVLPLLFACTGEEKETKKKVYVPIRDDDPIKYMEDLDFKNTDIVISLNKYSDEYIPQGSTIYIEGPDKRGSNSVYNKIYERNLRVESAIGVSPRYVYADNKYDEVMPSIVQAVAIPGPNTPDLYIDGVWGMARTQIQGYFVNVLDPARESHLDFGDTTKNDKGWYNPYMQTFNFSSDRRMYLLAGDYFMDVIRHLNLFACNLSDFASFFNNEGGTNYLYKTVTDGKWTIDKMSEWSEIAWRDTGTVSGKADVYDYLGTITTCYGPSGWGPLPSTNVSLFDISDGGKTWAARPNERHSTVIDMWRTALHKTGVVADEAVTPFQTILDRFTSGNALFMGGVQLHMMETDQFQYMEDNKCVLPYPKAYETDPYYVVTHDFARVGAILLHSELDDRTYEALTAFLQASSLSSEDILDEYYNSALKYKYSSEYGAAMMMDIIYDSIAKPYYILEEAIHSYANLTDNAQFPTWPMRIFSQDKSSTYASRYASCIDRITKGLADYQADFNKLK